MKFKAVIIASFVLGMVIFFIITYFMPNFVNETQKIGLVGRFSTNDLPPNVTSKISRGLTKVDENGNIIPDIAKSWETSDNGQTWIFKLEETLKWQDGKILVSKDINYDFSDANIEILDDLSIKFNLQSKFSAFPVIVTRPLFKKGLLGVGDYKVQNISLVGGIVQKLIIVNSEKQKIIYKFYPTEERLKLAFKLGAIDIIEGLQDVTEFSSWKTVSTNNHVDYNSFVALFFNTESEKLKDKTVRQALNYALDKEVLSDIRALGPISPLSWAYNPQVKKYLKDTKKTDEVENISIKISTLPNLLTTAEKITKQWKEANIKVEIEVVTNIPQNFDVFLATVNTPKDPDQYSLWHSTQEGTNISKYKNARIDKLLEDGRTELDRETRKKIYLDFQRFLVEDVPAIFLYHPTFYTVSRK